FACPLPPRRAELLTQGCILQPQDGAAERDWVSDGAEQAGYTVFDEFGNRAHLRRHDGLAGRHRLEEHETTTLVLRRQPEDIERRHDGGNVVAKSSPYHRVRKPKLERSRPEFRFERPSTDHDKTRRLTGKGAITGKALQKDMQPFLRRQATNCADDQR